MYEFDLTSDSTSPLLKLQIKDLLMKPSHSADCGAFVCAFALFWILFNQLIFTC